MMDRMNFWGDADSIESEIAPGLMSRRHTNRALRKHEIALAVLAIGTAVCFGGKGGGSSPAPDPQIGAAALKNAQIGEEWLSFAKDQFKAGNIRQDQMDALTSQVIKSQLASQDKSNQWAQEDRDLGKDGKTWFDQQAIKAGSIGDKYASKFDEIAGTFGNQAKNQFGFADQQQGRYTSTFQPIEDRIAKDAMTWDSAERQAAEAGKAKADVIGNAAAARAASERSMAAMGIDPRSGRHAGVERATDLQTALGATAVQNVARDNIRTQGLQLRGQAAQIGQQVLSGSQAARSLGLQATQAQQGATTAANGAAAGGITQAGQLTASGLGAAGVGYQGLGVGLTAGSSAVGNQGAANANFFQNNNTMAQGFGGAMQGYSNQGSILNNQYGTQVSAANAANAANAASSAGAMQGIGTVVGAGIMVF